MRHQTVIPLLAALLALAGCRGSSETLIGGEEDAQVQTVSEISEREAGYTPAGDFTLRDLEGNVVTLSSLRGKPVFLNFWATWCGPCVAEMPGIQQLHAEQGDRVHIVCVNLRESRVTVNNYLTGKGYGWTFLFDSDGTVSKQYQISAIPTTYVIDAEGKIRGRHVGSMNVASMRSMLQAAQ